MNPNLVPDILAAIGQTQQAEQVALQEMSTGRRVNMPSDDPAASAAMVQNQTRSDAADQYMQNITTLLGLMQTADSTLSSIVSEATQAISAGTEGANGTMSDSDRQALAQQVQGILGNIVAQANVSYNGVYLFAGTATDSAPFQLSGNGYTYQGNANVNSVTIGDGFTVQTNLPGSQLFQQPGSDLLGSLGQLVTALQSGTPADISDATTQLSGALAYLRQQRVFYGNSMGQLNNQETFLQQEKVNLQSQQNDLVGVDLAKAITDFTQAQSAHDATLAAAARALPTTLLDYLK